MTSFGVELGLLIAALSNPQPDRAMLERSAKETNDLLEAARRDLEAIGADASAASGTLAAMEGVRQSVTQEFARSPAERRAMTSDIAKLRLDWGMKLSAAAALAAREVTVASPAVATKITVATHLMDMRDQIARRNLQFYPWFAGQPVKPDDYAAMERLSGQVAQSWSSAQQAAALLTRSPALLAEIAKLKSNYEGRDSPKWNEVTAWARKSATSQPVAPWPESLTKFREWSVPPQVEIVGVRDAALNAALAESATLARTATIQMIASAILAALALATAIGAGVALLRRVVRPLTALSSTIKRIAGNELDVAVPYQHRSDELGQMAVATETLRAASLERLTLARQQLEAQSTKIEQAMRVATVIQEFEVEIDGVMQGLTASASRLNANAIDMKATAQDGTMRAVALASSSEQASANVQTVAAATEQLTSSIAEVSKQVSEGAVVARSAAENSRAVSHAVAQLDIAAQRVGEVVRLINGIAGQTNLLALNATIEAAIVSHGVV